MKREQSGTFLSAVFVDYDNIYLSLKRKSEDAAKRFAKDALTWIRAIETGQLITPTNGVPAEGVRRIVMNRCYGNPVPRRNTTDNSTDMNSFPFVRHHFLRAGFEIIDCPPLTAQLKNSSDIRMVMDVRDYLTHPTYFDEFVILSGDADFTPVLHRLRAHARRTVIFANDYTAAPYTAISDGEVRESDLIALLLDGQTVAQGTTIATPAIAAAPGQSIDVEAARREILSDVATTVRGAPSPVPLEVLADRAVRVVGHERTIGTSWGGAGGFRELLVQGLPEDLKLSGEPPYVVLDTRRHALPEPVKIVRQQSVLNPAQGQQYQQPINRGSDQVEIRQERSLPMYQTQPAPQAPAVSEYASRAAAPAPAQQHFATPPQPIERQPAYAQAPAPAPAIPPQASTVPSPLLPATRSVLQPPASVPQRAQAQHAPVSTPTNAAAPQQRAAPQETGSSSTSIQQSIARIHEACQAPPLAPPEYRLLFEMMAQEITENGLIGAQTIINITQRAQERGVELRRDDVRFVLEVVSETDPWFEQGASANLFAGRFRNFVVARCRSQGLNLSADELDLVEAWFAGTAGAGQQQATRPSFAAPQAQQPAPYAAPQPQPAARSGALGDSRQMWSLDEGRQHTADGRGGRASAQAPQGESADEFPRIVRTRLRG